MEKKYIVGVDFGINTFDHATWSIMKRMSFSMFDRCAGCDWGYDEDAASTMRIPALCLKCPLL